MASQDRAVFQCDFFFFQAEDGIRDIGVTGVQTCALPISGIGFGFHTGGAMILQHSAPCIPVFVSVGIESGLLQSPEQVRSEERRVGKERRSRWSSYH